jgi:hypothetical protein
LRADYGFEKKHEHRGSQKRQQQAATHFRKRCLHVSGQTVSL